MRTISDAVRPHLYSRLDDLVFSSEDSDARRFSRAFDDLPKYDLSRLSESFQALCLGQEYARPDSRMISLCEIHAELRKFPRVPTTAGLEDDAEDLLKPLGILSSSSERGKSRPCDIPFARLGAADENSDEIGVVQDTDSSDESLYFSASEDDDSEHVVPIEDRGTVSSVGAITNIQLREQKPLSSPSPLNES